MNFLNTFSKKHHMSNLMKIYPVGVELLHADRQTNRQTRNEAVAFCNFAKTSKEGSIMKDHTGYMEQINRSGSCFQTSCQVQDLTFFRWCCGFKSS